MFGKLFTLETQWKSLDDPTTETFTFLNNLLKSIDDTCDLSAEVDRSYFEKHPQLKEFMEKHADIGTYHNSFWKCDFW